MSYSTPICTAIKRTPLMGCLYNKKKKENTVNTAASCFFSEPSTIGGTFFLHQNNRMSLVLFAPFIEK